MLLHTGLQQRECSHAKRAYTAFKQNMKKNDKQDGVARVKK